MSTAKVAASVVYCRELSPHFFEKADYGQFFKEHFYLKKT
jgi:hypothetical protein